MGAPRFGAKTYGVGVSPKSPAGWIALGAYVVALMASAPLALGRPPSTRALPARRQGPAGLPDAGAPRLALRKATPYVRDRNKLAIMAKSLGGRKSSGSRNRNVTLLTIFFF